ncbi:glutamate-5-semialdehyde dehydrogenase [Aureibacillus halotolerans]|uniref:Gamma-glutamyl phosphate reductase n=1 Tax=Aureibacillus halotolerans TaxID=1508390 RepID=A0A4R6U6Q4_9BACI|nr:glutamate-5-semialdehyde dehydrogenase [Aureibacillus halotolerans]TDQ42190.1 glutamate-5-semialdehyde dehydrogenase [Aureibacillus halotolerans]
MSDLLTKATAAKEARTALASSTTDEKNDALERIAVQLAVDETSILEANSLDLEEGQRQGMSESLQDRLRLTSDRLKEMSSALRELKQLADPIGEEMTTWKRPNGLSIQQVRVPIGVIGMVYEARPNVTIDASSLCLKTGNAVLLRGSSTAIHSNRALVKSIQTALKASALPEGAVQLLEDTSRETAAKMFKLNSHLDVLIPRGSAALIQAVLEQSTVPVLETGAGNCHVFIDSSAQKDMAIAIAVNAKTQRPSVCNAAETLLVHKDWSANYLKALLDDLTANGVEIRGDASIVSFYEEAIPAEEDDWATEYNDLIVTVKMVSDVQEAIAHINTYGTTHSEAIVSETTEHVTSFFQEVDAAALYHNASTRFTDGFEFGFGAEIGISTQKLHARGPMGLLALTSSKYLIEGTGQIKG